MQPQFEMPNLAKVIEGLKPEELDQLPFGVIGLDPQNVIRVYSKTEQQQSGMGERPVVGRNYFIDVAPCTDNGYFKGRIEKARREGKLDVTFTFIGDFAERDREFTVRVQAAKDGGLWIFHRRADN